MTRKRGNTFYQQDRAPLITKPETQAKVIEWVEGRYQATVPNLQYSGIRNGKDGRSYRDHQTEHQKRKQKELLLLNPKGRLVEEKGNLKALRQGKL